LLLFTYVGTAHEDLSALAWFGDFVAALIDEFDRRVWVDLSNASATVVHSARNVQAGTSHFCHSPCLNDFEIKLCADFVLKFFAEGRSATEDVNEG
jgi:hypothetical protein